MADIGICLQDVDDLVGDAVFDYFEFARDDFKCYSREAATYFFDYIFRYDYSLLREAIQDMNGVYSTLGIEKILGLSFDQKETRKRVEFMKVVHRFVDFRIERKIRGSIEQEGKDSLTDLSDVYERVWNEYEDRTN